MHEPPRHRFLAPLAVAVLLAALLLVGWPSASALAATIQVTTTTDENDAVPNGTCSLREAILSAQGNADQGGCIATNLPYGSDTITFAAGTNGTATTLGSQLPTITTNIQIQGNGAGVTIADGNHAVRVFRVDSGTVGFTGLTIRNGDDRNIGGAGVLVTGGTVTFASTTLSGNSAHNGNGGGGASIFAGMVSITDSTLSDNSGDIGGGILISGGSLRLTNSTLSDNTAGSTGGGILAQGGSMTILNSTFSHNTGLNGGALDIAAGTHHVSQSTFKDNVVSLGQGAGIDARGGETTFRATIFANSTGSNCFNNGGTIGSDGSNLLDDASCPLDIPNNTDLSESGDQHSVANLNLGPLANNGGPTQTFALLGGSAAIDANQDGCTEDGFNGGGPVATDQRATGRPIDGDGDGNAVCDVGAFEAPQYGRLILSATSPVSESVGTATVTVTRQNGNVGPVTAVVTPSDGTATAPADFDNTPLNVSFNDGQSGPKQVGVPIVNDTIDEPDETLNVTLGSVVGATLGSPATAQITIQDDDPPPTISIDDVTVTEGDAGTVNAVFTVTLSNGSSQPISVTAATADGSATAGSDYDAVAATVLTFPTRGLLTQQFTVPVRGDTLNELNETFVVNLTNPTNATIAKAQGTGTITDDDPLTVTIDDQSVIEGNSGSTSMGFTVTLNRPSSQIVTVVAQTGDGPTGGANLATAGTDYAATGPTTLTFSPGATTQPFTVSVTGDTADEPNETFVVNLTNLSGTINASIADPQGVGTILDDDGAPALSIVDVSQNEGNSGTTAFTFNVVLLPASGQPVSVVAQTADGPSGGANLATAGTDYTAAGPTPLNFPPGVTSQSFTVQITGDTLPEADETFVVNLTNAVNAGIADAQGVGTIRNDDSLPAIRINDVSQNEGNSGTTSFTFTVSLSAASGQTVTVVAQTANGTAGAGSDYTATGPTTLTFPPGTTSQSFTVPVTGDTTVEPNETFVVNLTSPANATIADNQGQGTIVNDDGTVTVSINDVSQNEGNTGTTSFTFTVSLSAASSQTISVVAQTATGPSGSAAPASAGTDYTATGPTTLTFAPGTTSQSFTVPVVGDTDAEADETFVVNLTSPTNATIARAQGVGTIKNDDAAVSESGAKDNKDDNKPKETEEQRQQHQLTNRSNRDDVTIEGNVVEVHADAAPPYVVIANRDGLVTVVLLHDAATVANSIRVGQYLEGSGEKQNEQLFEASDVSLKNTR